MIDYSKIQEIVQDIYDIKIQWATKIAKSAFQIVAEELGRQEFDTRDEVKTFVKEAFTMLRNARDTEPLMFNGIRYVFSKIDECTMEDKDDGIVAASYNKHSFPDCQERENKIRPYI